MNKFFRFIITNLLLIQGTISHAEIRALFSPNGGVKDEIISQLANAKKSIDVAMYSFSDQSFQNALISANERGIAIRVILDNARDKATIADRFESNGIDVRYVIPVMHHKFAVIDGPRGEETAARSAHLITGSANWSSKSDTSYDEDFLVYSDETEKISSYQGEFDFLWDHSRDYEGPAKAQESESVERNVDDSSIFTSSNFSVAHSRGNWTFRAMSEPEDGIAGRTIVAAIEAATHSIQIATTHFRRKDFYEAISAAHNRGISISVLLDQQEYRPLGTGPEESDIFYDEKLAANGIDVRYKVYMVKWNAASAAQMHSKYMIIDGKTVFAGSFNWSNNSETGSFENLNILPDEIAVNYVENFKSIFFYGGKDGLENLTQAIKAQNGAGPCNFDAVSITGDQFNKLRKVYKSTACRSDRE